MKTDEINLRRGDLVMCASLTHAEQGIIESIEPGGERVNVFLGNGLRVRCGIASVCAIQLMDSSAHVNFAELLPPEVPPKADDSKGR